jgi:hypothetical protein
MRGCLHENPHPTARPSNHPPPLPIAEEKTLTSAMSSLTALSELLQNAGRGMAKEVKFLNTFNHDLG